MRLGHAWRAAVLASLALLVSGQLCMITTCVPRLTRPSQGSHACCGTSARATTPTAPMPATRSMPCDQQGHTVIAPALDAALAHVASDELPFLGTTIPSPPQAQVSVADPGDAAGPPPADPALDPSGPRAPPQG